MGRGGDGGGAGTLPVLILSIAAVSTDSLSSVYGFGYISGENNSDIKKRVCYSQLSRSVRGSTLIRKHRTLPDRQMISLNTIAYL